MNSTANDERPDLSRTEAPPGEPGPEEDLRSQLAEAQASADRHRDDYLRVIAEMDNLRKRTAREIETAQRYAVEKFAGDLLEARDSLERGIAAVAGEGTGSVVEGLQATLRLVDKAFERAGVTMLDPQGQVFDPQQHEAMATIEAAELAPGSIASVVQKGYLLNGRVLRPARVLVARQPST